MLRTLLFDKIGVLKYFCGVFFFAGETLEFGALLDDGLGVEVERRLGSGGQNNTVTQVQGLDCPTRNQYFVRQSDELRRAVQVFQLV